MAAHSRFTPAKLQRWRQSYGLTIREMAWLLGIPAGTLRDKLSGRHPPRFDTDRMLDTIELLLHRGVAPPGWPRRLRYCVHDNQ